MEPVLPEIKLDTSGAEHVAKALRQDDGDWLDVTGEEIIDSVKVKVVVKVVDEDLPMEAAVEVCSSPGPQLTPGFAVGRVSVLAGPHGRERRVCIL